MLLVVLAGVGATLAVKGFYQFLAEVPDRVNLFEVNPAEQLAHIGTTPGTVKARLFEARLRDPAPFGFFALANLFASLLIVLLAAAGGLAADKLTAALRNRTAAAAGRKRGEIHLPTLAAALSIIVAVAVAVVLLLTRSRGAIVAAAVALPAAVAGYLLRDRIARHWRRGVLAAACAFLLGLAAVVAYGCKYDRLPTRTMTFRWYYWTASARIVGDNPVFGVGPGNFPAAYLRYRRPAAEEAVKMPHNVLAHAATQYGLPGGALYLAIIAYVLVGMCRPRKSDELDEDLPVAHRLGLVRTGVLLVAAVVAARLLFGGAGSDPYMIVLEVALPAGVLCAALAVAAWTGGLEAPRSASRIALACGAAAFVLHNMVTFSLWIPATALVFWTAAGASLARTGSKARRLSAARWPIAAAGVAAVVAAVAVFWLPVYRKTAF
ncbi:MAG: O-antigen ligase family protein, partial [Phycisphaerae bacterium]|nr:O-antigen ligase family protein [Phycisphaerae bacterium]